MQILKVYSVTEPQLVESPVSSPGPVALSVSVPAVGDHDAPIDGYPPPPSLEAAAAVADASARLMRGFARVKSQLLALAQDDVEWSSYLLIARIAAEAPVRLSALAEMLQADPSTVSRQVAVLVKDGLVERRADPGDGRASLIVLTARGEQLHAEHKQERNEHYQRVLADWTEDECRTFAALTARFNDSVDRSSSTGWFGSRRPSAARLHRRAASSASSPQ
jgi:DNA-binding MarR family transcriptional regulator